MTEAELLDKLQSIENRCRIVRHLLDAGVRDGYITLVEDIIQDSQDIAFEFAVEKTADKESL